MSNRATRAGVARSPAWPVVTFAVDDRSAQLTWSASPKEGLRLEVGDLVAHPTASPPAELLRSLLAAFGLPKGLALVGKDAAVRDALKCCRGWLAPGRRALDPRWPAGPGAAVFEGLSPGVTYDIVASAEGVPRFLAGRLRALDRPPGRLLYEFATVSDMHVGEKHFGVLGRLHDPAVGETYPERALRAALEEAAQWGASLVVAKGDLTRFSAAAEVRDVADLFAASTVPVVAVLGNHDNQLGVNVRAVLETAGVAVSWQPTAIDVPGARLVLVHTAHDEPRHHRGRLPPDISRQVAALVGEAAETGTPAWVGLHHPPEMHWFPTVYPPGIPFAESRVFLEGLAAAQPATFVTCGHRHRNRRYGYGPLVISEVGSTKDYPGVWAGYRVFEGGLVQTVRRVSRPDVIAWTEATRRAMNGQWGRWSPGRLQDRCFVVHWRRGRR